MSLKSHQHWILLGVVTLAFVSSIFLGLKYRTKVHAESLHEDHSAHIHLKKNHVKSEAHDSKLLDSEKDLARSESSDVNNHSLISLYRNAWNSFLLKLEAIQKVDEDNAKLRSENAKLKLQLETIHFNRRSDEAKVLTHQKEGELSQQTGAKSGRTLASLEYKAPNELIPSQLFTLAVSYFKAREDEKAAVIFTHLANLKETEDYRTARYLLVTGVSWFRLENYSMADTYFNEVLKKPEQEDTTPYQARARLWKAVIAEKLGNKVKAQYWLRELMDHNLHSPEVKLVNEVETHRVIKREVEAEEDSQKDSAEDSEEDDEE